MARLHVSVAVTLAMIDLHQSHRHEARHHASMMVGDLHRATAWHRALALLCALLFVVQVAVAAPQTGATSVDAKAGSMAVMVIDDMHHGGQPCNKGDSTGLQHCFMSVGCFAPAILGMSALLLPDRVARAHWPVLSTAYRSQAVDPQPRPPRATALS